MPNRAVVARSEDGQWAAELTWTDHPNNLAWFVHELPPDGRMDALTVCDSMDDTGQDAHEVLRKFLSERERGVPSAP